ncbi:cholesterol 7-desaturase nvd [Penaeus vannamei]|uniref:cholesterol 7-desaturase nvd n=1 Tax=Penaeus vannamei TaxID=6689 RepID=UPI00387FABBD
MTVIVSLVSYLTTMSWPGDRWTLAARDALSAPWTVELLWTLLPYALGILLAAVLYRYAFMPLDRVRRVTEIGWGCIAADDKRPIAERIREIQRLRKIGQLPPVYPNGWFAVTESRKVKVEQVIQVQVFGETLAVFRSKDGTAHVTDAYCPHMGANMAVGGVVKGDCLECPFHGWLFRGSDGSCAHIPYSSKAVPKTANVKRWESREVNGRIYVWYDAEGRPPQWHIPEIGHVTRGEWSYRGRTYHEVLAHIQEIPENGADMAHLGHLHVPNIFKGNDLRDAFANNQVMDLAEHAWNGEWRARQSPESHMAELVMTHSLSFVGGKFKLFKMTVRAEQIGPGIVHLHFDTGLGAGILIQTVTPIEPLRQKIVHEFYTSSTFFAPYAKLVLLCEAYHVERDIMIWNSKVYQSQPLLVAEDRQILKFRRWYNQFYSENSPKFNFRKDSLEW